MVLHLKGMNYPPADYMISDLPSVYDWLLRCSARGNVEAAAKASPESYVTEDNPPILILNGFRDATVPPHQSEHFHCLLRQAGVASRLALIAGADHALPKYPETDAYLADFFAAHLQD